MEVLTTIIIVILGALYLFLFCVPGFFLGFEAFDGVGGNPGCSMIIMGVIGFPGMILGLLVRIPKIIKKHRREKEQALRIAIAEQKEREEEQRRIEKIKQRAEQRAKEGVIKAEKMLQVFRNSAETEKIVNYIKSFSSLPYKIQIFKDCVNFYYENGSGTYDFLTNGLNNLSINCSFIGSWEDFRTFEKQSEGYFLALAINEKFNNAYDVKEDWTWRENYDPEHTSQEMKSVTLSRNLKSF